MKIGLALSLTDLTISPADAAAIAEQRRVESIWIGEHTHLPVSTVHRYTTTETVGDTAAKVGHLPEMYRRFPDPYVTLAIAAAGTTTLRLGTAVALAAEDAPLGLAKRIATLDRASGGRFEWGVGYGWNRPEVENNGVDFGRRRLVLREKVAAVKRLWTEESTEFRGDFVQFEESWSYPKPLQVPHPPVLLGAKLTDATIGEAVAWADGVIPVRAMDGPEGKDLALSLARLREGAARSGRDPESLSVTIVDPEPGFAGKRSIEAFIGRLPSEEELVRYEELGLSRLILGIPVADIAVYRNALEALEQSSVGRLLRASDHVAA